MAAAAPTEDARPGPLSGLTLKMLCLGDSSVGKTSVMSRFCHDTFTTKFQSTIGVDFVDKIMTVGNNRDMKIRIWDTAGQERFRTITASFFRQTQGVLLIYDITQRTTFTNIRTWIAQLDKEAGSAVAKVIIGNKVDMPSKRAVSTEEGRALAEEYGAPFFETSAKTAENIAPAFEAVVRAIIDGALDGRIPVPYLDVSALKLKKEDQQPKKEKKCC